MKTIKSIMAIALAALFTIQCSKEESVVHEIPEANENAPKLNRVFPLMGSSGTIVTLKGENLSLATEVYFNGVKSEAIQTGGENEIVAEVPFRAFTGPIKVMFGTDELLGPEFDYVSSNRVSTLAGSRMGYADGQGLEAEFSHPRGITLTADGNLLVTDYNHKIRSITPEGMVGTLTGSTADYADGSFEDAKFNNPGSLAPDPFGNLFVSDIYNHKIRKVFLSGTVVTWSGSSRGFADGFGSAKFNEPKGMAVDAENNIFVADSENHRIRKISNTGTVTTIAGSDRGFKDGTGAEAKFSYPTDLVLDSEQNLYVADAINNRIRKITPQGEVTTYAGGSFGNLDGPALEAQFGTPTGLALDADGTLYVADSGGNRIRKISPNGMVSTIAGSDPGYLDGTGMESQFNHPWNLVLDQETHTLYVTDFHNHKIRKILLD